VPQAPETEREPSSSTSFLSRYAADLEQVVALRARGTSGAGDVLGEIAWRVTEAREAFAFGGPDAQARRALHAGTALATMHGLAGLARGLAEAESSLARSREEADAALDAAARAVAALATLVAPSAAASAAENGAARITSTVDPRAAWKSYAARLAEATKAQASAVGKDVVLEISASAAPVARDFTLIDAILAHLVRNAVDHGIEPPSARRSSGKASTGKVVLTLDCVNGYWFGRVVDDGGGVDLVRIRAAGRRLGVLRDGDTAESLEAVMRVLATPGITTRVPTSEDGETSGVGIGLDAVRTELKGYDGYLSLERTDGRGTSFTFSWRQQGAGFFWLDDDGAETDPSGTTRGSAAA
jgi:two-component system sensor histidine kinase and response regulator WspE